MAHESTQILFPTQQTATEYAELASYARKRGCALVNNDLWIAAIAKERGCRFVTYDKDFGVFQDIFGDKLVILDD